MWIHCWSTNPIAGLHATKKRHTSTKGQQKYVVLVKSRGSWLLPGTGLLGCPDRLCFGLYIELLG